MKKRVLSLALAVLMLVSLVPVAALAEGATSGTYTSGNVTYTLENGVLTVSGEGKCRDAWEYYFDKSAVTEVVIKDGVTSIGDYTFFGCDSLTSVSIPDSVTSIGYYAFCGCSSLTSITIPSGVTGIGDHAFYGCSSLTHITIPDSVTSIGYEAFDGCSSLTSITIPDGVTSIGSSAFFGCSKLKSISIPDSVTSIGGSAFSWCDSLKDVYYGGTQEQWNAIDIDDYNDCLTDATIHYNSAPHSHSYTDVITAPTCTKQGYTTHTCSCGDSYTDNYVAALGHDYADSVCTRCGVEASAEANLSDYEWSVLLLTNRTRLSLDLQPLTTTGFLQEACDIRAQELVRYYSHTRPDGTDCFTVLDEVLSPARSVAGENIAGGQVTPQAVVSDWISSPGHYANMINENYAHMGAGYCSYNGRYWVQFFFGKADCSHTSIELLDSSSLSFPLGTGIDEMHLTAKLSCSCCGASYLPVMEELCSGFDPSKEGAQTVTLSCFGLQTEFTVTVEQHVHSYTDVVTAPTCTEQGYTTHTCACGDVVVDTYVDALGHDYKDGACTVCGAADPDYKEPTEPTPAVKFTDVADTAYYAKPVAWAVDKGITGGYNDGTFKPMDICTRAQIVTFIWRANGSPEPQGTSQGFNDVFEGTYYYKAVLWAAEQGITGGFNDGGFHPDEYVTRAQAMTFLWRANGKPAVPEGTVNTFADVPETAYYHDAVLWAVANNITGGYDATTFGSMDGCTRAQIVTFLYRDLAQ